jgi:hypothetical protein
MWHSLASNTFNTQGFLPLAMALPQLGSLEKMWYDRPLLGSPENFWFSGGVPPPPPPSLSNTQKQPHTHTSARI